MTLCHIAARTLAKILKGNTPSYMPIIHLLLRYHAIWKADCKKKMLFWEWYRQKANKKITNKCYRK